MATRRKGWRSQKRQTYCHSTYFKHSSGCIVDFDEPRGWYFYGGGIDNSLWTGRTWPTWIGAAQAAEAEMARKPKEAADGT